MTDTPKLGITEMEQSQSQKHVTFNEAMFRLDAISQASVADRDLATPPGSPSEGDAYIIAATATGDWLGSENSIAAYQGGAWVIYAPKVGWRAWVEDESILARWDGSAWLNLVGSAGNGSAAAPTYSFASDPDTGMYRNAANELGFATGGSERFKIGNSQIITSTGDVLFNNAGSNSQATLNKDAAGDNSILNFQTGFTHHASIGLQGNNDFTIKTGTGFDTTFVLNSSTATFNSPEVNIKDGNGGGMRLRVIEEHLTGMTGASVTTTAAFPNQSIILGVSLRVTTTITGASSFDCGDGATASRFGGSIGLSSGTTNQGTIGPSGNYGSATITLTANGSNFTAGAVRVCLIYLENIAPTS